jgi:hypothetical protein
MKRLVKLLNQLKGLAKPQQVVDVDYLEHLNDAVEHLRDDRVELLKWMEQEYQRACFCCQKYRSEEDVKYYEDRRDLMKRLKHYLELLLTPDKL